MIVITLMERLFLTGFWLFSLLQRQLQVPLLWHPGEARFSPEPTAGGHPVHGDAPAACPPETEVRLLSTGGKIQFLG